jgi:Tfp pilus assembly protein PilE
MLWSSKFRLKTLGSDPLKCGPGVKGLSYVEVMVSMLTSALFLSTTLQGYIAATGIKAKSQQINTAIASIQADVEAIRNMAQAVPKTTLDCQIPLSSSYAQQLMSTVMTNDRAAFNSALQAQPSQATISDPEAGEFMLQQSSTLPINGLPDDYKLHRILSLDKREVPTAQVLQISYQVVRSSSQSTQPDSGETPDSPHASSSTETLLAQLHTSILPNAALVCF